MTNGDGKNFICARDLTQEASGCVGPSLCFIALDPSAFSFDRFWKAALSS